MLWWRLLGIIPGSAKSLWTVVKNGKDIGTDELPRIMSRNGVDVSEENLADNFADLFKEEVDLLIEKAIKCPNVYNGQERIWVEEKIFMTEEKTFKVKCKELLLS